MYELYSLYECFKNTHGHKVRENFQIFFLIFKLSLDRSKNADSG